MLIEIKGAQFGNQGARLMLAASLQRLSARFPQARFAMSTGPNASPAELSTVPAVNRIRLHRRQFDLTPLAYHLPRALHRWLLRRHRVCEPGLSAVLDVSGYAYGDRWGVVSASQTAAQLVRMHARGCTAAAGLARRALVARCSQIKRAANMHAQSKSQGGVRHVY